MRLRLALCQVDAVVGDVSGNTAMVRRWIGEAREAGAGVVVFPELVLSGYPPEDLVLREDFTQANREALESLVPESSGLVVVVGFVELAEDLHDSAAILCDGRLAGVYRKHFLPNYGVFDEYRYFRPGTEMPVWRMGQGVIGVNICEDIWYASGPTVAQAVVGGAQLVVNLSASPYHAGKGGGRERMIATRALDGGCFVALCNLVGGQDELVFDGHSIVAGPGGEILARGAQFAEDLVLVDLDLEDVLHERAVEPRPRTLIEMGEAPVGEVPIVEMGPWLAREPAEPLAAATCRPLLGRLEEVYAALVTGVRDYVAKTGFSKVGVALSGGIDSALTAAVAVDALGPGAVTGVTMPSDYTAAMSTEDALALGAALGIRTLELPIAELRAAYAAALADEFAGTEPGVAEENIQARVRGNLIMALANKFGWLVLATGNKSEFSVGYATLYGDMAGGFAVLKDVYKTTVYELARWRNGWDPTALAALELKGPSGPVIPERTVERPPSAELRPDQLDTDTLPPYDVLDPILAAYVEEDRTIAEIAAMGFDEVLVRRVAAMVERAEYKRRQGPVGIKITTRAFGKDRRMPIANGWRA